MSDYNVWSFHNKLIDNIFNVSCMFFLLPQVLVNRQIRELPFQVDDTVVLRIGDSIWLKNSHGVSYVCKLPHDVCIMTLSGRYFARTGGLLGNFNFEPYDDMKTPGMLMLCNLLLTT